MSKKYYPIEDAVNNVSQKFKLGLKDANEMDEEEFNNVEEYILKYVKFVSHPDYDLYVFLTPLTKRVIDEWFKENGLTRSLFVSTFRDQITGRPMYDVAFQYTPAFDQRI